MKQELNAIKDRLAAATPGPWEIIGGNEYLTGVGVCIGAQDEGGIRLRDAELIANAPTDLARLVAALEAVLVEHSEDVFRGHLSNGCRICGGGMGWPCPTVGAITEALKGHPA